MRKAAPRTALGWLSRESAIRATGQDSGECYRGDPQAGGARVLCQSDEWLLGLTASPTLCCRCSGRRVLRTQRQRVLPTTGPERQSRRSSLHLLPPWQGASRGTRAALFRPNAGWDPFAGSSRQLGARSDRPEILPGPTEFINRAMRPASATTTDGQRLCAPGCCIGCKSPSRTRLCARFARHNTRSGTRFGRRAESARGV